MIPYRSVKPGGFQCSFTFKRVKKRGSPPEHRGSTPKGGGGRSKDLHSLKSPPSPLCGTPPVLGGRVSLDYPIIISMIIKTRPVWLFSSTPRLLDSSTPRLPDSPTPRLPDSPTPRLPDSPTPRLPDSPTPRLPGSTIQQPRTGVGEEVLVGGQVVGSVVVAEGVDDDGGVSPAASPDHGVDRACFVGTSDG